MQTEDYLSPQPDVISRAMDPVEVVVRDADIARRVALLASRLAGGGVRRDDLEQELWLEVMNRVRRAYDPARGSVQGFVLVSLGRWARDARRRLRPSPMEATPTCDPAVLESVPATSRRASGGVVTDDLWRLRGCLELADQLHVELRLTVSDPAVRADVLGVVPRVERRRWRRILGRLRTAAEQGASAGVAR